MSETPEIQEVQVEGGGKGPSPVSVDVAETLAQSPDYEEALIKAKNLGLEKHTCEFEDRAEAMDFVRDNEIMELISKNSIIVQNPDTEMREIYVKFLPMH